MAQLTHLLPRLIGTRTALNFGQVYRMRSMSMNTKPIQHPSIEKEPWREDYNSALEDQTFTHNGQTIGFAEYGSQSGVPAFLLHGAPGSRYDGIAYHDSAKKLDVRIICPDRPGHGLSTLVPDRKLIDYPSGISGLAKHLKLGQYHVFGQSGGGPYAIACAHLLPQDELLNVAVVAGMGPPDVLTLRQAGWYTTLALWLHIHAPSFLRWFLNWLAPPESIHDDEKLQKMIDKAISWVPAKTRKEWTELENPQIQRELRAHLQCMFAQGWDGTIRDGQIYAEPWEFKLEEVQKKVLLIYGTEDSRTPTAFGKWYEEHLVDATLIEFEGASHVSIGDRVDEILARMVGKEDLWRKIQEDEAKKLQQDRKESELNAGSDGHGGKSIV